MPNATSTRSCGTDATSNCRRFLTDSTRLSWTNGFVASSDDLSKVCLLTGPYVDIYVKLSSVCDGFYDVVRDRRFRRIIQRSLNDLSTIASVKSVCQLKYIDGFHVKCNWSMHIAKNCMLGVCATKVKCLHLTTWSQPRCQFSKLSVYLQQMMQLSTDRMWQLMKLMFGSNSVTFDNTACSVSSLNIT